MRTHPVGSTFEYIKTATTKQVRTGRGRLRRIVFNGPSAASTVKVIDGTSGTTANIATITNTDDVKPYVLEFNVVFKDGLRIVTTGSTDITVVYD